MDTEKMLLIYLVVIIVLLIIYATSLLIENKRIKNTIVLTKKEHDIYQKYIDKLWNSKTMIVPPIRTNKETITKVEKDTDTETFMRYYRLREKGITLGLKDDNVCIEDKVNLMGFSSLKVFGRKSVELIDYYFDNNKTD